MTAAATTESCREARPPASSTGRKAPKMTKAESPTAASRRPPEVHRECAARNHRARRAGAAGQAGASAMPTCAGCPQRGRLAELAALIEVARTAAALERRRASRWTLRRGGRWSPSARHAKLVADGKWSASQPIECKLYEDARAIQVSLAENSGPRRHASRRPDGSIPSGGPTGPDQSRRWPAASVCGADSGAALKLARLAPRFLDMYRADEIEPDQLQALALTEEHAAQEAIWDGLPRL